MKEPTDPEYVKSMIQKIETERNNMKIPDTIKEFFDYAPTLLEEKLWMPTFKDNYIMRGSMAPFMAIYRTNPKTKLKEVSIIQFDHKEFFMNSELRELYLKNLTKIDGFLAYCAGCQSAMKMLAADKGDDLSDAIANNNAVFEGEIMFYIFGIPNLDVEVTRLSSVPRKDGDKYVELIDTRKIEGKIKVVDGKELREASGGR